MKHRFTSTIYACGLLFDVTWISCEGRNEIEKIVIINPDPGEVTASLGYRELLNEIDRQVAARTEQIEVARTYFEQVTQSPLHYNHNEHD